MSLSRVSDLRPVSPLVQTATWLWQLPRLVLVGVVRVYQTVTSPLFPPSCRYTPTCSEYAILSLKQYGAIRGTILSVWRILRCNPWGGHGHDPPRWFGEPSPGETETRTGE